MRRHAALVVLLILAGCALNEPQLKQATREGQIELTEVPFFPQDAFQCGPAALATVLAYSGQPSTPESLAPRMYLPERRGSLQVELVATARSQSRIAYVLPPTLEALLAELRSGRPVIVLQNLGIESVPIWHFAVVVGYSPQDEIFVLRSGTDRRKTLKAAEFGRSWALGKQWAMLVLKPGDLPANDDAPRYLKSVADVEAVRGAAGLVPAYRAALARWPDNRVARFGLARALDADGRLADAQREYEALLALDPNDPAPLNNLADVVRRSGCRQQALAVIDRALAASSPTHALRPVLELTRSEIVAMPVGDAASCKN
jgi:tetratricopeptide (TPR) repeat protein